MESNFSSNEIKVWLERPENRKSLSYCANRIYKKLDQRKSLPVFLGKKSGIEESREETLTIIESELVVFLFEKKDVLKKLIGLNDKNFSRYLETSFINHCIDIARTKTQDPVKYLYKRLSDALRLSEKFYTTVKNEFTAFSCYAKNRRIAPLTIEDLREIRFPAHMIETFDYSSINRKSVLLPLSEYFWEKVSQMLGNEAIWVNVWDVIEWIGLHVRLNVTDGIEEIEPCQPKKPTATNDDWSEQQGLLEFIPDKKSEPDKIYFDPQAVKKWASCFAEQLNQKEKAICYFSWALDLGLEEIAQKLGYNGPSGPHYLQKQTEDKLRKFLRDLDWLSPEDLNDKAFAVFFDTLISILKKSVSES